MQSWVLVDNEPMEPSEKTIEERVTALEQNLVSLESALEQALTM